MLITERVNSQSRNTSTSATDAYLIGSTKSTFSISGLQLRLLPILATIGLGMRVVLPSGYVFILLTKNRGMQSNMATLWLAMLAKHAVMLVIALPLIAWLSRRNLPVYGLQLPKNSDYVTSALLWGASFGQSSATFHTSNKGGPGQTNSLKLATFVGDDCNSLQLLMRGVESGLVPSPTMLT
jgi:hypothetical protein